MSALSTAPAGSVAASAVTFMLAGCVRIPGLLASAASMMATAEIALYVFRGILGKIAEVTNFKDDKPVQKPPAQSATAAFINKFRTNGGQTMSITDLATVAVSGAVIGLVSYEASATLFGEPSQAYNRVLNAMGSPFMLVAGRHIPIVQHFIDQWNRS